jgi:outer membrane biosynthesis protein TonB
MAASRFVPHHVRILPDLYPAILVMLGLGVGCATSGTSASRDAVPRSAGMPASPSVCRVTGAWTFSGQPIDAPAVTRCILPWYPETMRRANEEGEIVWRVAVDRAGVTDSSSVSVVRSSSPDLVVAVRRVAPYLRFAPQPGRSPIVVELPATFQLNR